MAADEPNPYAPPAAVPTARSDARRKRGSFEAERRPVILVAVLAVVTCGLYQGIWLLRRRPFLDGLRVTPKLGAALPRAILALTVITFVLMPLLDAEARDLSRIASLPLAITMLVANLRVASILRAEFRRSGRLLDVSSIATWFFGCLYLQYKINQAADTPPLRRAKRPPADAAASQLRREQARDLLEHPVGLAE